MRFFITFFCCLFLIHNASWAYGAQNDTAVDTVTAQPAMPHTVILNQQNAHAFAKTSLPILIVQGRKLALLPLPENAEDIQLSLASSDKKQGKILSWTTKSVLSFAAQSNLKKQRIALELACDMLQGTLTNLKAEENALTTALATSLEKAAAQDYEAISAEFRPRLTRVGTDIATTQRELLSTLAHIKTLKNGIPQGKQLVLHLDTPLGNKEKIAVEYSYILNGSYWRPLYNINANTQNNTIAVSLKAGIVQNSDMDWKNIRLELSTTQGNAQNPRPLRPWVVSKAGDLPRPYGGEALASLAAVPQARDNLAAKQASPYFEDTQILARWSIEKAPFIAEGKTTLQLANYTWQTPLTRIARPSQNDGTVWISAKHTTDGNFLPAGKAVFSLDGVIVGESTLAVKGNTLDMFFGADPLIRVVTEKDIRKSDESGIINKQQIYNLGWTYTVFNKRNENVMVRLEEPMTQLQDAAMAVKYNDSPKPQQGPEKTFIWNMDVPAKGEATVKRQITITAPEDMPIYNGK